MERLYHFYRGPEMNDMGQGAYTHVCIMLHRPHLWNSNRNSNNTCVVYWKTKIHIMVITTINGLSSQRWDYLFDLGGAGPGHGGNLGCSRWAAMVLAQHVPVDRQHVALKLRLRLKLDVAA